MEILALLSSEDVSRFRLSIARRLSIFELGVAALEMRIATATSKLIAIDPRLIRPDRFLPLLHLIRVQGNAAVLLYTALTPDTARAVIAASTILPVEAVFFGSYDERGVLASICEQLLVSSVPALVLSGLASSIAKMPSSLSTRVVGMFGGQPIASSTSGMLDGLDVPIDTAHEWVKAAGISKPHHLRACALLARAYPELTRKQERLERIAERFGMRSVRALGRGCRALTGLPARRAGRLSPIEFASRMVAALDARIPQNLPRR